MALYGPMLFRALESNSIFILVVIFFQITLKAPSWQQLCPFDWSLAFFEQLGHNKVNTFQDNLAASLLQYWI